METGSMSEEIKRMEAENKKLEAEYEKFMEEDNKRIEEEARSVYDGVARVGGISQTKEAQAEEEAQKHLGTFGFK